jgi:hypothetical protein
MVSPSPDRICESLDATLKSVILCDRHLALGSRRQICQDLLTEPNGAKLRAVWGDSSPQRGHRTQPRVSTLGP